MFTAAVDLITLHMLDGRVVQVNPVEITQLVHPREQHKIFVEGVRCVVRFTDGTFVSVVETCETIETAMKGTKQ